MGDRKFKTKELGDLIAARAEKFKKEGMPNLREQIGTLAIGSVEFPLFCGLEYTIQEVKNKVTSALMIAYAKITKDGRMFVPRARLIEVVGGEVQIEWYKVSPNREGPSDRVVKNHKKRVKEAVKADTKVVVEEGKKSRESAASVIREGLRRGLETEEIIKEVLARIPDSKVDGTHVAYYKSKLKKEARTEKAGEERMDHEKKARTSSGHKRRKR